MIIGQVMLNYVAWNVDGNLTDEEINEICDEMATYVFLEYKAFLKEIESERYDD